jgi:hypothetical protein
MLEGYAIFRHTKLLVISWCLLMVIRIDVLRDSHGFHM